MAIEVFNRYEHKYLLDKCDFEAITDKIYSHMDCDSHNKDGKLYTICNLYYDTQDDFLIRSSLEKPIYKEKLRLRSYGTPTVEDKVFLEIKKKFMGMVNKRRTKLMLSEAYGFIQNGKLDTQKDYINKQVIKELEYFLLSYPVSARLFLAYDRLAFFDKNSSDLRISFDTNIRSRRYDLYLELGDYGERLLDDGLFLMEVKTSLAKPLWLVKLLSDLEIRRRSFSKYGTEFINYLTKNYCYYGI